IALGGGSLSVTSSTFIGNKAWRGGALYLTGSPRRRRPPPLRGHRPSAPGSVRNSPFVANDATGTGDQITGDVAAMDRGATLNFANTLMYSNDPGQVDCNTQVWEQAVSYAQRVR